MYPTRLYNRSEPKHGSLIYLTEHDAAKWGELRCVCCFAAEDGYVRPKTYLWAKGIKANLVLVVLHE